MTLSGPPKLDPDQIVDQLYDIAIDPGSLDRFIDVWTKAGLDKEQVRQTLDEIDSFDTTFNAHLRRADTFLSRGETDNAPDLADALKPFESTAALILDSALQVKACNEGARASFGIEQGARLDALPLGNMLSEKMEETLQDMMSNAKKADRLLKLELEDNARPILFHIRRLAHLDAQKRPMVLIVTTQYHWQPALGQTLEEVFQLTAAEQGVVRALIEGRDAKSIAKSRGTSEGTVRSQIKSILAKMNARSQSEVIRLVLSLRDVVGSAHSTAMTGEIASPSLQADWLDAEECKPIQTLILPDGRRMDYLDQGPVTGAPVVLSHMGYALVRWSKPMLKLAFKHGLRVICPIRAGFGFSDNLDPKADLLDATRADTLFLMDHLGIQRLPLVTQGNDLMLSVDLAGKHPERVSEIIGICARPCLSGDRHYAAMGKWHRFFLSTAKHAPHLLYFTAKAAISMSRRIGAEDMFRNMNRGSPSDLRTFDDPAHFKALRENALFLSGKGVNSAQAYVMEILKTESDWSDLIEAAKGTPIWSVNGAEDPALDVSVIAEYRERYPWIRFEVIEDAGQLLLYQHHETIIPRIAEAAHKARSQGG